jgi:hypothetical protein
MIERLVQHSRHVADEATVTADVLNDAADLLKEAQEHILSVCREYEKVLRAYGYSESTDSIRAARDFIKEKLT